MRIVSLLSLVSMLLGTSILSSCYHMRHRSSCCADAHKHEAHKKDCCKCDCCKSDCGKDEGCAVKESSQEKK